MICIVFVHGWGFNSSIWDKIHLNSDTDIKTIKIDFGYTGQSNLAMPDLSEKIIYVGHSLGVLWLLKHIKNHENIKGFVSINGFDCFYKFTPAEQIQTMKNNIDKNHSAQMRSFYHRCGLKKDYGLLKSNYNIQNLKTGLDWLETWDCTKNLSEIKCKILAICSENDRIVPITESDRIWGDHDMIKTKEGSHILPISAPDLCSYHINEIIRKSN